MTGKLVAFFVIFVVVIGIGLAIYNSGILGGAEQFLSSLGTAGTSTPSGPFFTPYVPPPSGGATPTPGGTAPAGAATPTPIPSYEIPAGMTASDLSPYFHQVRFGGLTPATPYSYGQISLYAYPSNQSTTIDVTGWKIQSNRGGEYIPQAVNLYDPSGLTPASDIFMKYGDTLTLYSTSAPVNLRLNECIGYLPNRSQFTPQLPQTCPLPDYAAINTFSGACRNYIQSLGSCGSPNMASPYIPQNDYACVTYLQNHFNYRSCYESHIADANFLSSQILVFMGSSPLDPFHDTVKLLDRNGLVVDVYSY